MTQAVSGAVTEAVTEADLRARLADLGIGLRPEDVAPALATARFLARAAEALRAAPRP